MKRTAFIPFRLPGMNDIIKESKRKKGNWYGYATQKRKTQKKIGLFLSGMDKVAGKVWVNFVWVEISRRRDPDNIAAAKKFIFDAMVEQGIIENDGWKNIAGWSDEFIVNKKKPGVEITIREI